MTKQINQVALEELREGFTGEILLPEDPAYDEARQIYNAMIDRHPGVIAQCAGVEDVVRAGALPGETLTVLARKFGLACDNLLSVELVTADGGIVIASEEEHHELFWALHGGGGNFGVATSFTFQLYSLPTATMALLVFSPGNGKKVVSRFRNIFEAEAPDVLSGELSYLTGPPEDFVPSHLVDRLS